MAFKSSKRKGAVNPVPKANDEYLYEFIDTAVKQLKALEKEVSNRTSKCLPCPDLPKNDAPQHVLDQYTLTFEDTFDGPTLDCNKWATDLIWTREEINLNSGLHLTINSEEQFYVDTCNGEDAAYGNPFTFNNGNLQINADPMPNLPVTINGLPGGQNFTSGNINTYDSKCFKYGYVEVCAKLPCTCGAWPAIWLLHKDYSFNNIAEIDLMEGPVSCDGNPRIGTNCIQHAYHYTDQFFTQWDFDGWQLTKDGDYDPRLIGTCGIDLSLAQNAGLIVDSDGASIGQTCLDNNRRWCDDFHTFGVDWCEGEITYYVDGYPTASVCEGGPGDTVYDQDMYLIINHAVGGEFPGDAPSTYSDTFEIEYARIYEKL